MRNKIAFIGVGNMASAIISGITSKNNPCATSMSDIVLYDKFSEKTVQYQNMGATVALSERDAVEMADCVFLCVKPQNFSEVLPCFNGIDGISNKLFVTIAAGIPMKTVEDATGGAAVVRALPNTPIFIGKGVCAICRTQKVSDSDLDFICNIFSASGSVIQIDEDQMNRIIGVTSSSPAYVFLFVKSILEGARAQGLVGDGGIDEQTLIGGICDMIIGSAELMKVGGVSPDEQIKRVASKGGTTEQALLELERYSFTDGIISAMKKCTARADELGRK